MCLWGVRREPDEAIDDTHVCDEMFLTPDVYDHDFPAQQPHQHPDVNSIPGPLFKLLRAALKGLSLEGYT